MNPQLLNLEHNNLCQKIETSHIFQELESQQFIEKIFKDILLNIKNSNAYIHLKEIALLHFTCIMSEENESEPSSQIEKKKAQSTQIGFLSDAIGSTITRTVAETLKSQEEDIQTVIKKIIKDLIKLPESSAKQSEVSAKISSKRKSSSSASSTLMDDKESSDSEDSDTMENFQLKRAQRSRKPNAKYFSEEIISSVTDCYFNKSNDGNVESSNKKRKLN